MRVNKTKKIIVSILLAAEILVWPFSAFAQLGTLNPVPTNDAGSTVANTAFSVAMTGPTLAYKTCLETINKAETANSVAQLGFSGMSIIGGDAVLMVKLGAMTTAYTAYLECANINLAIIREVPAPNMYTASKKLDTINQITTSIQAYKIKLEQVQARFDNAKQGFWKTLVFNILIKTSKAVTNALVAKLVSNYKIRNMMQYGDSVATLMYDNQFIRQNFPEAEGQFMARAILNNPAIRYKVPSYAYVAADSALGFNPSALDVNDPNFYSKMASVGSGFANPYFQHTSNVGGVDQARAMSLTYAQKQIDLSSGLKTPVTCAGSLSQQQAIDDRYKQASKQFDDRNALLNSLQRAKELGQPVSEDDLKKAQADFDVARNAMKTLPINVTTPATKICEAIVSPPSLINKGIDEAFKSVGTKLGQYDSNNLPGFINIIGDVASQIGSNLIFGGASGAKNALLMNEGRMAEAAISAGTEAAYSQATEGLAKGVSFEAVKDENYQDGYVLNWDATLSPDLAEKANFVTIQGDGISATKTDPKSKQLVPNKLSVSGSALIHTSVGGSYVLTVFSSTGLALTAVTLTVKLVPQQAANYNPNSPKVAGAYTIVPSLQIRGMKESLHPRGP